MKRYFIEVAYNGAAYAGFQIQQNANTIQAEVEKALLIYFRTSVPLTGSSRTDAGVHALQNFFHFDASFQIDINLIPKAIYHLNAILPNDIVVKSIKQTNSNAHARFDALYRSYQYNIHLTKNPFKDQTSFYYPFKLDIALLNQAAEVLKDYSDFQSFSKKNTQVFTYNCTLTKSVWATQLHDLVYNVQGNRFLRGMVRGLVGTMLKVGRGKYSLNEFKNIIESKSPTKTDFSTPSHGLFLKEVGYNDDIFL
ncbi:tRNA pseudouridine(38-40) synthase TruA [Ferruginibacter yonginensis]|uniref:tRNA pseudouridine synthase A n=1 Tax=Ferruginibacter yonginensis TaxID=1310416 RepID=A0ABV8QWK1_9BACT